MSVLAGVESVLRRAFETDDAVAVALVLNSPGGSPAQSELIAATKSDHLESVKATINNYMIDALAEA